MTHPHEKQAEASTQWMLASACLASSLVFDCSERTLVHSHQLTIIRHIRIVKICRMVIFNQDDIMSIDFQNRWKILTIDFEAFFLCKFILDQWVICTDDNRWINQFDFLPNFCGIVFCVVHQIAKLRCLLAVAFLDINHGNLFQWMIIGFCCND